MGYDWRANFRAAKEMRGWSWEEISTRSGVKISTLKSYFVDDKPKQPPMSNILKLLDAFGESFESLFLGHLPQSETIAIAERLVRNVNAEVLAEQTVISQGFAHLAEHHDADNRTTAEKQ